MPTNRVYVRNGDMWITPVYTPHNLPRSTAELTGHKYGTD